MSAPEGRGLVLTDLKTQSPGQGLAAWCSYNSSWSCAYRMLFPMSINVPVRSREKLLAAIFMLPAAFNMLSDSNQQANDLQEVAAPDTEVTEGDRKEKCQDVRHLHLIHLV